MAEGSYLLTKTKINHDNNTISEDDLKSILKQQPNRKILGILRFHLRVFNFASRGKERKWKNWLKTVGEEPVILDSSLTKKSSQQLNQFLKNKGYFNSIVTDSTSLFDNKSAHVQYFIKSGLPYTVNKITFAISDNYLLIPVMIANNKTLLKTGANYDSDVFTLERERMANSMKNLGYYNFSKEYIFFEMDSSLGRNRVDVKQTIKNPLNKISVDGIDSLVESRHRFFYINKVYINSNYNPLEKYSISEDTIMVDGYCFLGASGMLFHPEVLLKAVYIKKNDIYGLENVEYTHSRLSALKTFKFISIRFEETDTGDSLRSFLDCYILLTPSPRQSMTFETEGTNRSGALGMAGELVYNNKNTFKGAETLEIKLRGGLEAQKSSGNKKNENFNTIPGDKFDNVNLFNTIEINPQTTLFIPSMLIPFGIGGFLRPNSPKTNIITSYNYQQRPRTFNRQIFNASFGYSWKSSIFNSHSFFPFDISIVKIDKRPDFQKSLDDANNPLLVSSFSDHLISSSKYSYTFSNQQGRSPNFMFFKWNLEGAGNFLQFINKQLNTDTADNGSYHIFINVDPNSGIQYAQYLKTDADLRFYKRINKHSNVVYRMFFGIGKPLKNFPVLPFEKSYFGGGANGLRAWKARSVGPGASRNKTGLSIDKVGDIQLEGNVEYRFDLIKILDGAAFIDAGNVWSLKEFTDGDSSDFDFSRFYKEIAIGAGIGARLDFDFFIIRLDMGVKVKDPLKPNDEKGGWVIKHLFMNNQWQNEYYENHREWYPFLNFNLGIGYPF